MKENWQIIPLGKVCKLKNGFAFKSDKYLDKGIPVIRISDIKDGLIVPRNTVHVSENSIYDSYIINENEIIVAMSGATTGKFGIYKSKGKAYQNQRVGKFDIIDKTLLDNNFLLHQLHSLKRQIEKDAYGGAQPNISSKKIEEMEIVLPPLQTQQAIVSKIEELFSELDKGIEDLKTAQQQLKTYRQSVLKWAFEGKLTNENVKEGELPEGWEVTTFGKACDKIFDGTHFSPKNYPTGKYKYITAKNIKEKGIDLTKISFVNEEDHKEIYSRSDVKKGDVLYIKDGATTGIACINNLDEEFSLLSSVGVFRVNPIKILSKYLCFFLNSQVTRNKMLSNIAGVAITRLTLIKLKNSEFIFAPIEEQHRIVQEIESRLSVADKMEESIAQSLQQAEALRQSILKKAFSGELV